MRPSEVWGTGLEGQGTPSGGKKEKKIEVSCKGK